MKKALITGITGQDGAYMANLLLNAGYDVYGTYRRISSPNFWRLSSLGIEKRVKFLPCDVSDSGSVYAVIERVAPDVVYHLAAQSYVFVSFDSPISTFYNNGLATLNFLEALRRKNLRDTYFYNAATSEMFGNNTDELLNERSSLIPESPYACSKVYSFHMTRIYREAYGLKAFNGILFNHESELRGLEFVTRKISNEVARIFLGISKELRIGNILSERDWGYAPEYVQAMKMIMDSDNPTDYVVATGESHSVKEFLEIAFSYVGLDWTKFTKVNEDFVRKHDVYKLRGDYSKIRDELGWRPKMNFRQLVGVMVKSDVERWTNILRGKMIPTDALFYEESLYDIKSWGGSSV